MVVDPPQLPTPPEDDDDDDLFIGGRSRQLGILQPISNDAWRIPQHVSGAGPSLPFPMTDELPGFEESQSHELILGMSDDNANIDPLLLASSRYDLPDPNGHDDDDGVDGRRLASASPSSSLEAEADDDEDWHVTRSSDSREVEVSPSGSPSWQSVSGVGSPSESGGEDGGPFGNVNVQKRRIDGHGDETDIDFIATHQKTA
jgi:ubiquitin carboxyl-terminal hydrolase 4/11/15